jgi:hypothetical protein
MSCKNAFSQNSLNKKKRDQELKLTRARPYTHEYTVDKYDIRFKVNNK